MSRVSDIESKVKAEIERGKQVVGEVKGEFGSEALKHIEQAAEAKAKAVAANATRGEKIAAIGAIAIAALVVVLVIVKFI